MAKRDEFFVSYNSADRAWAEWIAWTIEAHGYTTRIQAWDFRPGAAFPIEMMKAAAESARTIAVLSPHYVGARFTQAEWAMAFHEDPTGAEGKLLPVRVADFQPEGIFGIVVHVDLVGLDESTAQRALLAGLSRERAKPATLPQFPGSPARAEKPGFPGAVRAAAAPPHPVRTTGTSRPRWWRYSGWAGALALPALAIVAMNVLCGHPPPPEPPVVAPERIVVPSVEDIANAVTAPGEPTFPVSCVAQDPETRVKVLKAIVEGPASWNAVPDGAVEKRLFAARAATQKADAPPTGLLEGLVAACPASPVAHNMLGAALTRKQWFNEAEAQLRIAAAFAPGYIAPRMNLAILLTRLERWAEAVPWLDDVLTASPADPDARKLRGQARLYRRDISGAIDDLRAHTDGHPEDGAGFALLAEALARSLNVEGARAAACRAAKLGVQNAQKLCGVK
jgi:hypothetical protein